MTLQYYLHSLILLPLKKYQLTQSQNQSQKNSLVSLAYLSMYFVWHERLAALTIYTQALTVKPASPASEVVSLETSLDSSILFECLCDKLYLAPYKCALATRIRRQLDESVCKVMRVKKENGFLIQSRMHSTGGVHRSCCDKNTDSFTEQLSSKTFFKWSLSGS